ncbi:uncharacterized protein LOC115926797 [Strongylocentrotus purpuratus]|uniref:Reverse transcriptase zinc-binding domain-containing protein n=1 Tax=Strongylocentrotus purpuratus TaxID=7668 RepID=A0A7M7P9J4_STRPU|nr:uncharacterized protein LOC115926797 [Strongylocentrotus purpuratus]
MYNNLNDGGLKMTHIESFCKALKIAWVKRVLDEQNDGHWKKLFYANTKQIGVVYIFLCNFVGSDLNCSGINGFWKDILFAWSHYRYYNPVKFKDIMNQSLWNNSHIKIDGKTIMYKKWFDKGILFVKDIMKIDGSFKTFLELQEILQLNQGCYLEYFALLFCMKKEWKRILKIGDLEQEREEDGYMKFITFKKVTKPCYEKLVSTFCLNLLNTNQCEKWSYDLNVNLRDLIQWQNRFEIVYWVTLDTKIRVFQFKFIHRRLATNDYLYKIGIHNSPVCNFCKKEPQSLLHLFCTCSKIQQFWSDINAWLLRNNVYTQKFSYLDICFGFGEKTHHLINTIVFYAKYFIYKTKYEEKNLSFLRFTKELDFLQQVEYIIAFRKGKQNTHKQKWRPLI